MFACCHQGQCVLLQSLRTNGAAENSDGLGTDSSGDAVADLDALLSVYNGHIDIDGHKRQALCVSKSAGILVKHRSVTPPIATRLLCVFLLKRTDPAIPSQIPPRCCRQ